MTDQGNYDIQLEVQYAPLTHIDVNRLIAENEPWWNRTLTQVDDSVIRLGILHGEFHWHKHDDQDEFFLVLEGELLVDFEREDGSRETVSLKRHEGITVPKGVMHCTRAPEKVVVLMVEAAGVIPTGD